MSELGISPKQFDSLVSMLKSEFVTRSGDLTLETLNDLITETRLSLEKQGDSYESKITQVKFELNPMKEFRTRFLNFEKLQSNFEHEVYRLNQKMGQFQIANQTMQKTLKEKMGEIDEYKKRLDQAVTVTELEEKFSVCQ